MSQQYQLQLKPSPKSMRFLHMLKRKMEKELGRRVSYSELFNAMCGTLHRYIDLRTPEEGLQAPGHRGLPGHRPGP